LAANISWIKTFICDDNFMNKAALLVYKKELYSLQVTQGY